MEHGALRTHTFEAIGTQWAISLPVHNSDALAACRERIAVFDQTYSRFRTDSLVYEMSKRAGTYTLPADAKPMFDLYQSLYTLTEGALTPLVGDVLIAAGYDASYSLVPKEMRPAYEWEEAIEYQFPMLTIKKPTMLDLGALGKGYLVDLVAEVLVEQGVSTFVINAGGDVYAHSSVGTPTRIALENPFDTRQAIGVVEITNQSLCGSASNRRVWSGFSHIIDPDTMKSPTHLAAVWVVAEKALLADALTTALYFAPPEVLQEHYSFDYLLVRPDHEAVRSEGFLAELFT